MRRDIISDKATMIAADSTRAQWEARYQRGEARVRYPFDLVVGFILGRFPPDQRVGTPVLDYGCGVGNHLWFLVDNEFAAYGVDCSGSAVSLARETIQGIDPNYPVERIVQSDGMPLPFEDASFEAVIDRSSIGQNRSFEIPAIVDEIHRVLKPGGTYYGINFSDRHPDLAFGTDFGEGDYGDFSRGALHGIGVRHFFSPEEVQGLFSAFDLEDIRLLEDRSLMGKGGNVQIVVRASKPHSKDAFSGP